MSNPQEQINAITRNMLAAQAEIDRVNEFVPQFRAIIEQIKSFTQSHVKLFRFAYGLGKPEYGITCFAMTVVDAPADIPNVRLAVGSNSASIWWVNGQEAVGLFTDRRMVMDDGVSKRLTLKKGANLVQGAVINGPGMSDFCVRFIDENGDPVKNITVNLDALK